MKAIHLLLEAWHILGKEKYKELSYFVLEVFLRNIFLKSNKFTPITRRFIILSPVEALLKTIMKQKVC